MIESKFMAVMNDNRNETCHLDNVKRLEATIHSVTIIVRIDKLLLKHYTVHAVGEESTREW